MNNQPNHLICASESFLDDPLDRCCDILLFMRAAIPAVQAEHGGMSENVNSGAAFILEVVYDTLKEAQARRLPWAHGDTVAAPDRPEPEGGGGMSRIIKTPIAAGGAIALETNAAWGSLMAIGAIVHTARYDRGARAEIMQTDEAGLEMLADDADVGQRAVHSSLQVLGELLATAEELDKRRLDSLAWLMTGLGEIGLLLHDARWAIGENLDVLRERREGASRPPAMESEPETTA